jgi:haloalkane dehalogenase
MSAAQAAGAVSFVPSPDLFPFGSRWLESSAGRVHYVDEGGGRPLLMLHGNPTWSFLYRHLITELRGGFRCVAVDYPGFGLSDRPPRYGYTPAEHARVVGELVEELDLRDLVVVGHDWGGPIGLSVASATPERVEGLVLGNTWFWPADRTMRVFSRVMSSGPMQRAILRRNFFVERIVPAGTERDLTREEMDHYRGVQPTAAARVGVAEFPRQIVAAGDWLHTLSTRVPEKLADKRVLVVWPMRDRAFPAGKMLPRVLDAFSDAQVVKLPRARHYLFEDAPNEIARAIAGRFGAA